MIHSLQEINCDEGCGEDAGLFKHKYLKCEARPRVAIDVYMSNGAVLMDLFNEQLPAGPDSVILISRKQPAEAAKTEKADDAKTGG